MGALTIHSRIEWGFPGWADPTRPPASVPDSARTEFFTHYEGAAPTRNAGAQAMRAIDAVHRARGWAGIGYNHVVMQDGSVWEGRGWALVGAHCPDHNTTGYGVQVHVGGDQQPSPAALRTCRALYDEACRRAGHRLAMRGHRDGYPTECPGPALYRWVQAGMPAPTIPPPPTPTLEDHMLLRAKTSSTSKGKDGVTPLVPAGAVLDCAAGVRHHISGAASPLVHACIGRGVMLIEVDGQDVVEAYPIVAAPPVPPVPPVDVHLLAAEIVAVLPPITVVGGPTAGEIADVVLARLRLVQGA